MEKKELLSTLNAIRYTDLLLDKDQKEFNEWCDEIKNAIYDLEVYKKAFLLATEEITDCFGEPISPEYIGDREIEGREERRNYFLAKARKELNYE